MSMKLRAALSLLCLAICQGQNPPPAASPDASLPVFKAGAREVLLDVVVRDRKGQPVSNLQPLDLEIYDNGVRQKITSFRSTGDIHLAPGDPLRPIRLLTLIYNRLDLESRSLARKASLDLLRTEFPPNVFLSILILDDGVRAVQPFTNDPELLKKAIEHATSGTSAEFISDSRRIEAELKQQLGPTPAGAMAQMMWNVLQTARASEMSQTGRSAVWGLINIISRQYTIPGRKSVLFLSPGFGVPLAMEETWKALISTANRFNVSFYSLDCRGLSTVNPNDALVSELRDAASASQIDRLSHGNNLVTPEVAKAQDLYVDNGNAKGQNKLADLAASTGGFLIANTNDFRNDLRRMSEDIESYYQVTYDPQIDKYDGSYRKIEVRGTRPNLRIQSRAGYFALPASAGKEGVVSPFELPLMRALGANPLPREFEFQAAVLRFFGNGHTPESSIVLDVPLGNLTLTEPQPAMPYQGGLAYVALIRNSNGDVERKLRGEIPVFTLPQQVAALRQGHFLHHEYFDLSPGRYTLETAVSDKLGNKVSARRSSFRVPSPQSGLAMSSVSMVRAVRDKYEDTAPLDPFLVQGKLVTPALSSQIEKTSADALSFYFVVYPYKDGPVKPKLTMKFTRDGVPVSEGASDLGAPDAAGRVQYIATARTEKLALGNYEVEFLVSQGSASVREFVWFSLE